MVNHSNTYLSFQSNKHNFDLACANIILSMEHNVVLRHMLRFSGVNLQSPCNIFIRACRRFVFVLGRVFCVERVGDGSFCPLLVVCGPRTSSTHTHACSIYLYYMYMQCIYGVYSSRSCVEHVRASFDAPETRRDPRARASLRTPLIIMCGVRDGNTQQQQHRTRWVARALGYGGSRCLKLLRAHI